MAEFTAPPTQEDRARLDELFTGLVDRSGELAPVSDEERAARRERLARLLGERDLGAFLCEGGSTLRYLTGVEWGHSERLFALVVLADGGHFWLAPGFERERAELVTTKAGGEIVPWPEDAHPYAPLAAELDARSVERAALEPWLRHRFAHGIAEALGPGRATIGSELLLALRGRKDGHELALLRHANELTQEAICAVAETLEPGVTSSELGLRLTVAQERLGLTGIWHLALIGPGGALPHGDGRERTLQDGDPILVDTGGALHGYQSDNTRSWVLGGRPSQRFQHIWHTVRDAQRAAFEAIRPGRVCREVDRTARAVIEAAGYGADYEALTHRLGHGIGMDGHEDPYFDGGSLVELAPGMTFSDEPGIYLRGELGLRIEDIVCVTPEGADHFGRWQAGPEAPHPA